MARDPGEDLGKDFLRAGSGLVLHGLQPAPALEAENYVGPEDIEGA